MCAECREALLILAGLSGDALQVGQRHHQRATRGGVDEMEVGVAARSEADPLQPLHHIGAGRVRFDLQQASGCANTEVPTRDPLIVNGADFERYRQIFVRCG